MTESKGKPTQTQPRYGKIAIFCVGNKLLLDDGLGPVVFEELTRSYDFPDNVELFDVGCMGLDMIGFVDECDYILTIDAVDGTGHEPGTVFEFETDDMARHVGATASIHELTLADLFDSAALLGYECEGKCFGMQVSNIAPTEVTIALTKPVYENIPLLIDSVLADLHNHGIRMIFKSTGEEIEPGFHHTMTE